MTSSRMLHSRRARWFVAPAAIALAGVIGMGCAFAQSSPLSSPEPAHRAATTSCANRNLPSSILDGVPTVLSIAPLRVLDVRAPSVTLHLAVASNDATRELGLMCVLGLRPHAGMLFAFATTDKYEFWMKRTLIPLDMLWVDADGRVTSVAANVPASTMETPDDKVARRTGTGRYVIELSAGEAAKDGIAAGTHLVLGKVPPVE